VHVGACLDELEQELVVAIGIYYFTNNFALVSAVHFVEKNYRLFIPSLPLD
jgi:hypothetical protein